MGANLIMDDSQLCEVCSNKQRKYKCPKCGIIYCSLVCYKEHQAVTCMERAEAASIKEVLKMSAGPIIKPPAEFEGMESEDRVPQEFLDRITDSHKLLRLLENPHLRAFLSNLNSTENPSKSMENAMKEPLFLEFADECLKVVEPLNMAENLQ